MIRGRKLSGLVLASMILAGGTVFGVQPAGAADDTAQQIRELQQGVNANRTRIAQIEEKQAASQDYSTDIKANADGIAANKKAIGDNTTAIASNKSAIDSNTAAIASNKSAIDSNTTAIASNKSAIASNTTAIASNKSAIDSNTAAIDSNTAAIAAEKTARENGETSLNDRITNVKEYLQKDAADTYVTKDAAAVQDGAIVKAKDTIGNNVTNLDAGLAKETAARIGADKAQDKVIEQVNENASKGIAALKTAYDNETAAREAADNTEKAARESGDKALDDRITNVKEYLQKDAADTYVTKDDAAVKDGAIVKAKDTIGNNVTNLDAGLAKETAARIGADKAQDKVIAQVNENASKGIAALKTASDNETAARVAEDKALDDRITNVKEYLQKDAADTYVTKDDAAVQDGAIVKAKDTIGNNVTNLDAGLAKETAARIGADKAQDKVIQQVNENASKGIAALKTAYDQAVSDQAAINKSVQDTLNSSGAVASADATEAAKKAAAKANEVADGLKDRIDVISGNQDITSESDLIKKDQSIGQNLTNVDTALHKEIAARIGADKAQDKVIEKINSNVATGFDTINKNIGTITTQLNQQDANEAAAREAADNTEKAAREAGDKALDDRITNVKEYLQKDAADTYVTKDDAAVKDGAIVKAKDTIGNNVTNLDAGLAKETAARIGADKAQDKVIEQVNENASKGIAALKTAYDNETATREAADKTEAATREAEDQKLQGNIDKEVNDRKEAVSAEETARKAADKTLQTNIDNEVNDRKAAVSAEETARKAADTAEAKARADADTTETNARTAADKTLQDNIDKEANERTVADNALQTGLNKEIATREDAVTRLQNRIHDVSKEVDTVGALSMAMSGLHPLSYDEGDARFQLSAAVGTYDGTQALALGGFYHFNHDTLLSVGVATDIGGDEHRMGANIGFTKRIGQGGRMTSPSEGTVSDIMNDIRRLEQKQAELEQENAVLKQQVAALQK